MQEDYEQFLQSRQSVIISSLDKEGLPHTSYAPFVFIEDKVYILISAIAKHFSNLATREHVSLFFVEDESKTEQIYARKRLNFEAKAYKHETKEPAIIEALRKKHGDIVTTLESFQDFALFSFELLSGRYVAGFGKAYEIDLQTKTLTNVKAKGHTKA